MTDRRRGRLPGTRFRFGLNSVIGLAPGAGDALLTLIWLYIVYEAARLGLPRSKIIRMLVNVAVESGLGVVLLLGDLLDVVWKANSRNVTIIDEHFGIMSNRDDPTYATPAAIGRGKSAWEPMRSRYSRHGGSTCNFRLAKKVLLPWSSIASWDRPPSSAPR